MTLIDIRYTNCSATLLFQNARGSDVAKEIEVLTYLDSIDVSDGIGKEVVIEFKAVDIDNNGTFYTDSNGMEMQKRVRNFRPTWDLEVT